MGAPEGAGGEPGLADQLRMTTGTVSDTFHD